MSKAQLSTRSHHHANVLGVEISAVNMEGALHLAETHIASGDKGYVCVTGVHGVMEAQKDTPLMSILNGAAINAPDGMPMTWVGKIQGHKSMDRVYGPDFMLAMCELSVERGYRNFLYGGQETVAQALRERLVEKFPGLQIVGTYTPPFRPLNSQEEGELVHAVSESRPDIIWVGLSTPKQEKFMASFVDKLDVSLMVGVGAAFDMHTGRINDAPSWMKRAGLQWLHRLMQEPERLAPRYLRIIPMFIARITHQLIRSRFMEL